MAGIVGVALALAALRNAGPLTATIAHNLVFLMLPSAIVVAVVAKATPRHLATGFAAFGWAYYLFNLLPLRRVDLKYPVGRPTLLIEQGFLFLQPYLKPMQVSDVYGFIAYHEVSQSLATILCGIVGAIVSQIVVAMVERRPASEVSRDDHSQQGVAR
jgi:hypothetical protein